jgi:hypothetical protein
MILMKLGFSRQIFEKYSNIELHEDPSSGAELFHEDGRPDGKPDRSDEANSRFTQFCERA